MKQRNARAAAALAVAVALACTLAAPATAANPETGSTADPYGTSSSTQVLVNREHPLDPLAYEPAQLVAVDASGNRMVPEAAKALALLIEGAGTAGHRLLVESTYRSYEQQRGLFNRYTARYGSEYASRISARPGTSEHQLGLAADVGLADGHCALHACFGDTAAGRWVASHGAEYGFIVRYPKDGEPVTGYKYEPWHLRYVGVRTATAMEASGVETYEEYVETVRERRAASMRLRQALRVVPNSWNWYPLWSAPLD